MIRHNLLASTAVMVGCDLLTIGEGPAFSTPVLEAAIRTAMWGTVVTYHERVVLATGVGAVGIGLEEDDPVTEEILAAELNLPLKDRRILTIDQLIELAPRVDNPFPFEAWKSVGVWGPRDGGRIAVGMMTGHEAPNGFSVPNLDRVEEIRLYGETALTKETYSRANRLRYGGVPLEMPRPEQDEDYYYRLTGVPERASVLRDEVDAAGERTGRLRVLSRDLSGNLEEVGVHDHLVVAPGYIDRTMEVLPSTQAELVYADGRTLPEFEIITGGNALRAKWAGLGRTRGVTFVEADGTGAKVAEYNAVADTVILERLDRDRNRTEYDLRELSDQAQLRLRIGEAQRAEVPPPFADVNLLATEPLARKVVGLRDLPDRTRRRPAAQRVGTHRDSCS